jgi:hypothetical protein
VSDPLGFGAPLVAANRTGRDATALGRRSEAPDDEHRLLLRLRERAKRSSSSSVEDPDDEKVDHVVEQWLQREERLR